MSENTRQRMMSPCRVKRIKASMSEFILKNLLTRARQTAIRARHSLRMMDRFEKHPS